MNDTSATPVGRREESGKPKRRSIRSGFLITTIIATLVVTALFAVAFGMLRDRSFHRDISAKTAAASARLADSLKVPLWVDITEACDEIIASELDDGDFSAVFLYDKGGVLVSAAGKGRPPGASTPARLGPGDEKALAAAARSSSAVQIRHRGMAIGELRLYASGDVMLSDSRNSLLEQILLALLEGTLVALLAFFVADRFIARRVIEMGDQLTLAQDRLVETRRVAALGQLVAGVAHQLNTPLGAIASANRTLLEQVDGHVVNIAKELAGLDVNDAKVLAELLAECAASDDTGDYAFLRARKREIIAQLEQAGLPGSEELSERVVEARLHHLGPRLVDLLKPHRIRSILTIVESVNDIRRASMVIGTASGKAANVIKALRVYLGQSPREESVKIALAGDLEEVVALFGHMTRGGIELGTRLDRSINVAGRREQLDLVWMNLIDNAIEAMQGKGHLEVLLERELDMAKVSVIDDGPGIGPEHGGHIFDAFYTSKTRVGGLGLGLSSAKTIVTDHGGRIEFQSRPGHTEFLVHLPLDRS
ncbi:MAG: sensor histidine kinase [Rectinemataceae bacterium]